MIIKNVRVYTEEQKFVLGEIVVLGDRITKVRADGEKRQAAAEALETESSVNGFSEAEEAEEVVVDGEGAYAIPGLIDLHFHGCVGADVCDGTPEALKKIAQYEASDRDAELDAPREYGLSQQHKHLKEMRLITGLSRAPLFTPIVSDYYSGMVVNVPLYTDLLNTTQTPESLQAFFADYYANEPFVKVMPLGAESEMSGFLSGNHLSGYDGMQIYITGNENRIQLSSVFDNLGKGASGAAIQCFNIMTGCDETKGLNL